MRRKNLVLVIAPVAGAAAGIALSFVIQTVLIDAGVIYDEPCRDVIFGAASCVAPRPTHVATIGGGVVGAVCAFVVVRRLVSGPKATRRSGR